MRAAATVSSAGSHRIVRYASRARRGKLAASGPCRASVERARGESANQQSQRWPPKPVAGPPAVHTTRPPGPVQAGTLSAVDLSRRPPHEESRRATIDPIFPKWTIPHGMRWFFPAEAVQEDVYSPVLIAVGTSIPLVCLFILAWPLFLDQLAALPPLDQVKW